MPFACRGKSALKRLAPSLAQGHVFLGLKALASTLISTLTTSPNNNFFQEFMRTFIKKAQVLAALVTPAAKTRNNTNRPLKPQNPNLYYGHLYIKCYYFC